MADIVNMGAIRGALETAMKQRGIAARRLSTEAGLNETAVRDLLKSVEDPKLGTLLRLAKALNLSRFTLLGGMMPVSGIIGAAGAIEMTENGQLPLMVPVPLETDGVLTALKVEGDYLLPRYHSGDVVYCCKRPGKTPADYIGTEVMAKLDKRAGGGAFLKILGKETLKNRFGLRSFNAEDMDDVSLAWVAPVVFVMRWNIQNL